MNRPRLVPVLARLPAGDFAELQRLAAELQEKQGELLRVAVHELLAKYRDEPEARR